MKLSTMLFSLAAAVTVGFFVLGCPLARADEQLRTQAINSVVELETAGTGVCSGVAVDVPGFDPKLMPIMTAKHCIDPKNPVGYILVTNYTENSVEYKRYPFKTFLVSQDKDLAAIVVNENIPGISKAKVAEKLEAQEGDQVWTVGYPKGIGRTTTTGIMNNEIYIPLPDGHYNAYSRPSTAIDHGNSGGGLFQKTAKGYELIGIASMMIGGNFNLTAFVSTKDVINFVKGE